MKKLSDFKGEAAIELWADLIDIAGAIIADPEIAKHANEPILSMAKAMLKLHKKEVCQILLTIDDTPLNGLNVVARLVSILTEISSEPELSDFFGLQGQTETDESSGSATENTKAKKR